MRPRLSNAGLPKYVQHRHGAYYLIKGGRWINLGRDLKAMLAKYRRLMVPPGEGIAAVVDAALSAPRTLTASRATMAPAL